MPGTSNRSITLAALCGILVLAGCAQTPIADESPSVSTAPSPTADEPTPEATGAAAPVPSGAVFSETVLPSDCEAMLDEVVLTQLADLPLNDPSYGASGKLPDQSLRCVWGAAGADTTRLITTVNYAPRNDVLDYLNVLQDEGYTCYEPASGIRCEHTWENEQFPVTDGRTLFYRDGVLIDTQYSNVTASGYTAAIVRGLWPEG